MEQKSEEKSYKKFTYKLLCEHTVNHKPFEGENFRNLLGGKLLWIATENKAQPASYKKHHLEGTYAVYWKSTKNAKTFSLEHFIVYGMVYNEALITYKTHT